MASPAIACSTANSSLLAGAPTPSNTRQTHAVVRSNARSLEGLAPSFTAYSLRPGPGMAAGKSRCAPRLGNEDNASIITPFPDIRSVLNMIRLRKVFVCGVYIADNQ